MSSLSAHLSNRSAGHTSVEVVMCTYNGGRFLSEQLQSIATQTQKVDRICIYDDGSRDNSLSVATAFANQLADTETSVRVVRNAHNLGYAQNFALALSRAEADIVFFCDQDDVWEPGKVERLVAALESSHCNMAFCDGSVIDAEGRPIAGASVLEAYGVTPSLAKRFSAQAWPLMLRRNYANGAAMAVRRVPAQRALPIPPDFPHDYWLALWLALDGGIECVPQRLYRYRQHDNNQIGMGSSRLFHQLVSIWRNPSQPRRMEIRRVASLVDRLPGNDARLLLLRAKQDWLLRVAGEQGRWSRLAGICRSLWRGDYARFAPPQALLRDVVAAIQGK